MAVVTDGGSESIQAEFLGPVFSPLAVFDAWSCRRSLAACAQLGVARTGVRRALVKASACCTLPSRPTRTACPSGSKTSSEPSARLSTIMRPIVHDRRRGVDQPGGLGRATPVGRVEIFTDFSRNATS